MNYSPERKKVESIISNLQIPSKTLPTDIGRADPALPVRVRVETQ